MTGSNLAEKLVNAWNSGSVRQIGDVYATDARLVHPMFPAPLLGRPAIEQAETGMFSAFSEVEWKAERVVASDRDVAIEFRVIALNSKPLQTPKGTLPATHKRVDVRGASIVRLSADGLIAEEHRYFDIAGMFAQLGLG